MSKVTLAERFAAKWILAPATGCHLWTAAVDPGGYGVIREGRRGSKLLRAHIYAYVEKYGPVPEGLQLDHFRCDTRHCVNPDHVRPATNRENVLRSNSVAAVNLAKTHCDYGHEFTPNNIRTVKTRSGGTGRACRKCDRRRTRDGAQRRAASH